MNSIIDSNGSNSSSATTVPVWVAIVISLVSVALTLGADRIGLAGTTAALDARVTALEKRAQESREADYIVMGKLDENGKKLDQLAVTVQQIIDRQDEVRRKLRMNGDR